MQRPTIMYLNWTNTKQEQVKFDYEKDEWLPFEMSPTLRHTFLLSKADNNNIDSIQFNSVHTLSNISNKQYEDWVIFRE